MVLRKSVAVLSLLALILGIVRALLVMVPAARAGSVVTWQPFVLFLTPAAALTIGAFAAIVLPPKELRRAVLALMLILLLGSLLIPAMSIASAIACVGFIILAFLAPTRQGTPVSK